MAFLTKGLRIILRDSRTEEELDTSAENGQISELLKRAEEDAKQEQQEKESGEGLNSEDVVQKEVTSESAKEEEVKASKIGKIRYLRKRKETKDGGIPLRRRY